VLGGAANGIVSVVATAPDGTVYAGGAFTTIGGVAANRVARWVPGTGGTPGTWQPLGAGSANGADAPVYALAVNADGSVYVGGEFRTAGAASANGIVRWVPGPSGAAGTWQTLGTGTTNGVQLSNSLPMVYSLAAVPDGSVYVGGNFKQAGGAAASFVARWVPTAGSATAGTWDRMAGGVFHDDIRGGVWALTLTPNGQVIVGGTFVQAGRLADAIEARHVARWTGAAWEPLGGGVSARFGWITEAGVRAVAVGSEETVVLGGSFERAGDVWSPFVTQYDVRPVAEEDGPTTGAETAALGLAVRPNPVATGGTVRVVVPVAGRVRVALYDVLGRQVAVLLDGERGAGEHILALGADRLAPGVYVVRVEAGGTAASRRLTVVR